MKKKAGENRKKTGKEVKGMKQNRDPMLENMLRKLQEPVPDEELKRRTVNRAVAEFAAQPVRITEPLYRKLFYQAGYIGPMVWVMQLIIFLITVYLFNQASETPVLCMAVAAAAAPLFGLIGVVEIARSFSHQMWELENACRYNLRYVLGMRMMVMGLADLILFVILIGMGTARGNSFMSMAVCLLVPFHLSNMVYLGMLMKTGGRCPVQLLLAAGLVMIGIAFGWSERFVFTADVIPVLPAEIGTAVLLLLTFCGMLGMIGIFLKKCSWEEQKVWS